MNRALLALAALTLTPLAAQASIIINVEAYNTTANPTTVWDHFTTIRNLSNTDYVDASQSTWTYVDNNENSSYTSDTGQSFTPNSWPLANGFPPSNLNNGVGQTGDDDAEASNWGFDFMTIDLGEVVNVTEFNSYTWANGSRQDQGYTLYYSAADIAPTTGGDLVGWTSLGSVATTYWTETSVGHQIGVSFSDTGGTLASARFLLMAVSTGSTGYTDGFFGEVDVLTAVPEPGSLLALGCLIGSGALLRSRRR